MSFCLSPDNSLGESIRRVVLDEIESAVAACTAAGSAEQSQVWDTRKHLKRARAALRLLAAEVARASYRQQVRRLRNVGRLVSDIFDAEVRLGTVREMRDAFPTDQNYEKTEEMLAFELDSFLAAFDGWQEEAAEKLRRAQASISEWPVEDVAAEGVLDVVENEYKAARRALARVRKKHSARRYDELRKATKTLCYSLRLLHPIEPETLRSLSRELKDIAADLVHANDLGFVVERLHGIAGRRSRKRGREAVEALLDSREKDLQRKACRAAERALADKPRVFIKTLAVLLERWRHESEPRKSARAD